MLSSCYKMLPIIMKPTFKYTQKDETLCIVYVCAQI